MRISDWSSDVCSSDLIGIVIAASGARFAGQFLDLGEQVAAVRFAKGRGAGVAAMDRKEKPRFIAAGQLDLPAHLQGQHETALAVRDAERVARVENDEIGRAHV